MTTTNDTAPVAVTAALRSAYNALDGESTPIIRRLARIQVRHAIAALASAPAGDGGEWRAIGWQGALDPCPIKNVRRWLLTLYETEEEALRRYPVVRPVYATPPAAKVDAGAQRAIQIARDYQTVADAKYLSVKSRIDGGETGLELTLAVAMGLSHQAREIHQRLATLTAPVQP